MLYTGIGMGARKGARVENAGRGDARFRPVQQGKMAEDPLLTAPIARTKADGRITS